MKTAPSHKVRNNLICVVTTTYITPLNNLRFHDKMYICLGGLIVFLRLENVKNLNLDDIYICLLRLKSEDLGCALQKYKTIFLHL